MELWLFNHELGIYRKKHPGWRKGQAMFNFASDCFGARFQVAPFQRSGLLDPFYEDGHCDAFLEHLLKTGCLEA